MEIAAGGLAIFGIGSLIRGLRFRRGSDRSLLGLYRNAGLPVVFRNLALIMPLISALILVLIGLAAARFLRLFGEPSVLGDAVLGMVMIQLLVCGPALLMGLAYWAPRWLTPTWLKKDDGLVGYVPPNHGWEDRVWLLISVGAIAAGIYFLAVVISLLPARDA